MKKRKISIKCGKTNNVDRLKTTREEQLHNLGNSLYDKRSSSSDVTMECNGGVVKAHRVVLTSSCDYFNAMFHSNLKESNSGKVEFPEINVQVMETVVKFLYTGLIEEVDHDIDCLKQIMSIAHMMHIITLLKITCSLLIPLINWDNYMEFWNLASKFDQRELVDSILKFIIKNFDKFEADENFAVLTFEQMSDLLPRLADKYSVEKQVKVALRWVGRDTDEKLKVLGHLLNLLNLNELSKKCLYELSKDNRIQSCLEILPILFSIAASRSYKTPDSDEECDDVDPDCQCFYCQTELQRRLQ